MRCGSNSYAPKRIVFRLKRTNGERLLPPREAHRPSLKQSIRRLPHIGELGMLGA